MYPVYARDCSILLGHSLTLSGLLERASMGFLGVFAIHSYLHTSWAIHSFDQYVFGLCDFARCESQQMVNHSLTLLFTLLDVA